MSEVRELKQKVDRDFIEWCKNKGYEVLENAVAEMFFSNQNVKCDYVIKFKNKKMSLGVNKDGHMIYDNMISKEANILLADYYTHKLTRRGKTVTRTVAENKIILRVV